MKRGLGQANPGIYEHVHVISLDRVSRGHILVKLTGVAVYRAGALPPATLC